MIVTRGLVAAFVANVLMACGGDPCDAEALTEALAQAMPGDTVTIGECTIPGAFTVAGGVTLRGQNAGQSTIDGRFVEVAINIEGTGRVEVRDLSIISGERLGILARGAGERAITDVEVSNAELGVGVAIEGATLAELTRLSIDGPIDASSADFVPDDATPMTHATHGLVLVSVVDAQLVDVNVSGFAKVGTLIVTSTVHWDGGSSSDNLALGIGVENSVVTLEDVAASRTFKGGMLLPAYGAFTSGATVSTTRFRLLENEGNGLLQHYGRGVHTELEGSDNEGPAVSAQFVSRFELDGDMLRNRFAGLVLVDVQNAVIHDSTIDQTALDTQVIELIGYTVGDGIHVTRSAAATVIRDVTLANNERAGVLFELGGGSITSASLDRVTVTVANAMQVGVVAQNGVKDPSWDSGVMRIGTTPQDDAATPSLSALEAVGPCNRPRDSELAINGLSSLIGF